MQRDLSSVKERLTGVILLIKFDEMAWLKEHCIFKAAHQQQGLN